MSETHPIPGAGAVVIKDGLMLLIRRRRGAYVDHWAVPGGRQRRGETMREAAARETFEETGLIVEVGDPVWVGDILDDADPPAYHYTVVDFYATVVGGELSAGDDAAEARWIPVGEVREMPLTPTMFDLIDNLGL
ncbi:MAG: NUDIX domain-containing protein [Actinomycetota bacterium]|nr:NUDIX domain-containing protein [Actinomycetota bacterium]